MLLKGWRQLSLDLFHRRGLFAEAICIPFAVPAITLWPLAVIGSVIASFFSSFVLGCYGAVVAYQEDSLLLGLTFTIAVISLFDEYTNDLLYMREGSCFPRPAHRSNRRSKAAKGEEKIKHATSLERNGRAGTIQSTLASQRSQTLGQAFKRLKAFQIWDWLFRSCEENGRSLLREGLVNVEDIADCVLKGDCKKLSVRLPAWCILQCILRSAKSDAAGLLIDNEMELTDFNWPKDKVLEWLLGPLLIMKEQIKELHIEEGEEACLGRLVMMHGNQRPEDWDESGFPSDDKVRRAQLQGINRRLQGIVVSLSRLPTFRRRFLNLVKVLYMDAVKTGAIKKDNVTRNGEKLIPSNESSDAQSSSGNENSQARDVDVV